MSEGISRESLHEMVWAEPMLHVAKRYNVSSSYMARVCTVMNVPRPAVGYWGKQAVGKAPAKKELPPANPSDQLEWIPGRALDPTPRTPVQRRARATTPATTEVRPDPRLTQRHPMLKEVRAFLEVGKVVEGYLKPAKRLMLDVLTSKNCLDHILDTADVLLNAFERKSHSITFAADPYGMPRPEIDEREGFKKNKNHPNGRYPTPWSPQRPTVAHFGSTTIGLALLESSEEVEVAYVKGDYLPVKDVLIMKGGPRILASTWTSKKYYPTGRLRLVAYVPVLGVTWQRSWRESATERLAPQADRIVSELEKEIPTIEGLIAQARENQRLDTEKREAEWKQLQETWAQEHRAKLRKERIGELLSIVTQWENEQRAVRFLNDMDNACKSSDPQLHPELTEKLEHARAILIPTTAFEQFRNWVPPDIRHHSTQIEPDD